MKKVVVIKIECLADGRRSVHEGKYVSQYDPEYKNGWGRIWTVESKSEAAQFSTAGEALEFWRQTSTVKPLREDGKPNRPMTAYTITLDSAEESATAAKLCPNCRDNSCYRHQPLVDRKAAAN